MSITKTLRERTKTGWTTKPVPNIPANRLIATEVDDNFLALEERVENKTSKNYLINGNFDIWQRGTSFTSAGDDGADRWRMILSGSSCTNSRQAFTLGQTDVPGNPVYYNRMDVTSVAGAGNYVLLYHRIEGVHTLSGEEVTLSFWVKADAAKPIAVEFVQNFGTGGSPSSEVNTLGVTKPTLSTSWQKVSITVTLPSVSGKTLGTDNNNHLGVTIWFDAGSTYNSRTDTLGQQSGVFDIAQAQLEIGDQATEFEFRTVAEEMALCKRYYDTEKGWDVDFVPNIPITAGVIERNNILVDGNLEYWDEGTAFTSALGHVYTATMWMKASNATVGRSTATPNSISNYSARVYENATYISIRNFIPSIVARQLRYKNLTLSFWVRRYSAAAGEPTVHFVTANAVDVFSAVTYPTDGTQTFTTAYDTWEKKVMNFTLTSADVVNGLGLYIFLTMATVADVDYRIAQIKLELGDVATPFYQGPEERQRVEQYYQKSSEAAPGAVSTPGSYTWMSITGAIQTSRLVIPLKTEMRTTPTVIVQNPNVASAFGRFNNITAATNIQGTTYTGWNSSKSIVLEPVNAADVAANDRLLAHYFADARFYT